MAAAGDEFTGGAYAAAQCFGAPVGVTRAVAPVGEFLFIAQALMATTDGA